MSDQPPQRSRFWVLLPVLLFAGLAGAFMVGLQSGDPSKLPSALINKPAPDLTLPSLEGLTVGNNAVPGLKTEDLNAGSVTIVNVWASWCGPCREEHPQLMQLAKRDDIRLVGMNYKDQRENAVRFLNSLGNPFSAVGVDATGRTAVDWGVYGVPETFIVDGKGFIVHKFTGPITDASLRNDILPAIEKARAQQ